MATIDDLLAFIGASPSPFHAVAEGARRLGAAGFTRVAETDPLPTTPGRYWVERGGALVAWCQPVDGADRPFRVVGAHTDSPNLRLKPAPDRGRVGWRQLGVEVYGGALWNSWLDRDLGLSGRVVVDTGDGPQERLFRLDEPLLRVPQLAIHLDRDANAGLKLNPQEHLVPVWGLGPVDRDGFRGFVADLVDVDPTAVVAWDAMVHDLTPPTLLGRDQELVAAPRLDNLLSCWAALDALIATGHDPAATVVPVVCLFDHEEVGSGSATGAAGSLLPHWLERIATAAGDDRDRFLRRLAGSACLSADGAHATHPNYPERHDPDHLVAIDGGPVIKVNANQRYATDARSTAVAVDACRRAGVPHQLFVSRNDQPCGSTIGPDASRLGLTTVDVGVAQLSMHSARELCGAEDPVRFAAMLAAYLAP